MISVPTWMILQCSHIFHFLHMLVHYLHIHYHQCNILRQRCVRSLFGIHIHKSLHIINYRTINGSELFEMTNNKIVKLRLLVFLNIAVKTFCIETSSMKAHKWVFCAFVQVLARLATRRWQYKSIVTYTYGPVFPVKMY